jgi:hypothetical protein
MGKLLDWLAFEAIPKAVEKSPVRQWPYPVRVTVAIFILAAIVIVFVLLARDGTEPPAFPA